MKILMITPFASPNLGGVETHVDKLIKEITKRKHFVTLLTYQPLTYKAKGKNFEKHRYYEIYRFGWFGYNLFPRLEKYFPLVFVYLFTGLFIKSLYFYLKNHRNYNVIHVHGLASAAIGSFLIKFSKKRLVLSTHAVYNFENREILGFFVKRIFKSFDCILAVSEISKTEIINLGYPGEKIKVHPNWIDTNKFKPVKITAKPSGLNILFIGRLIAQKGIMNILKTADLTPDVNYHIVGSGPAENEVKKQSLLLNNLTYYGTLIQNKPRDFKKILSLYSLCDYLISPYLYDEGFSAVLIESLSCGTPVIISKRGSPPTFLSKDVAVFLSPNPDSHEITKTLKSLSQNKKYKNSTIIKSCRDYALKYFGPKNAEVIIDSYSN